MCVLKTNIYMYIYIYICIYVYVHVYVYIYISYYIYIMNAVTPAIKPATVSRTRTVIYGKPKNKDIYDAPKS